MSKFIGKFTAPGTGDVGVLGIEITHDFGTGMKEGVVRLEKRPYWEGGATPFTLEMPATSERAAMRMTGIWIERGLYDGEGCCNVTVTGCIVTSLPATPALDELTDPADLDWGAIRSACDRRDWREAWGIVGTDHVGDATPGEVYLLSVARHKSATAAALWQWRKAEMESGTIFIGADAARAWRRIKGIAAWESSARAQYVKRPPSAWQRRAEWLNERIRPGTFQLPDDILGGRYSTLDVSGLVIDDPVIVTPEWAATHDRIADLLQAAMPAGLSLGYRTAEDDAMTRGNGGVVGVLSNPHLSAAAQRGEITGTMTITAREPVHFDAVAAVESELRHQLGALIGQPITQATQAQAEQIAANVLHNAQRNTNPAPRGPQTRKRR